MPTLVRIGRVKVRMFYGDHNPPHVHAHGGGHFALIRIDDREYLAGSLPPRIGRRVKAWIAEHEEELMMRWRTYRSN
jgi:hypothetical protein